MDYHSKASKWIKNTSAAMIMVHYHYYSGNHFESFLSTYNLVRNHTNMLVFPWNRFSRQWPYLAGLSTSVRSPEFNRCLSGSERLRHSKHVRPTLLDLKFSIVLFIPSFVFECVLLDSYTKEVFRLIFWCVFFYLVLAQFMFPQICFITDWT